MSRQFAEAFLSQNSNIFGLTLEEVASVHSFVENVAAFPPSDGEAISSPLSQNQQNLISSVVSKLPNLDHDLFLVVAPAFGHESSIAWQSPRLGFKTLSAANEACLAFAAGENPTVCCVRGAKSVRVDALQSRFHNTTMYLVAPGAFLVEYQPDGISIIGGPPQPPPPPHEPVFKPHTKLFEEATLYFHGLDVHPVDSHHAFFLFLWSMFTDGDCVAAGYASRVCLAESQNDLEQRQFAARLGRISINLGVVERAWKANDPEAHDCAGFIKYCGLGCLKDISAAVAHFEEGAKLDHPDALCKLGFICHQRQHSDNLRNTVPVAFEFFRRSAVLGHPVGQRNLGNMHEFGQGTPVNKAEAIKWHLRAAAQENVDSMIDLARLCRQGYAEGGREGGIYWLRKAASRGSAEAAAALAKLEKTAE